MTVNSGCWRSLRCPKLTWTSSNPSPSSRSSTPTTCGWACRPSRDSTSRTPWTWRSLLTPRWPHLHYRGEYCEWLYSFVMSSFLCPQTLDGGLNVIQLETAVGAAMKSFDNALGINVPRSRFLPVKTTSDLLLVMSNLYSMEAGSLTMSPKREFPTTPHVKLGSSFTKVSRKDVKRAAVSNRDGD